MYFAIISSVAIILVRAVCWRDVIISKNPTNFNEAYEIAQRLDASYKSAMELKTTATRYAPTLSLHSKWMMGQRCLKRSKKRRSIIFLLSDEKENPVDSDAIRANCCDVLVVNSANEHGIRYRHHLWHNE